MADTLHAYLCWDPDDSEYADGNRVLATSPEAAVRRWAEIHDAGDDSPDERVVAVVCDADPFKAYVYRVRAVVTRELHVHFQTEVGRRASPLEPLPEGARRVLGDVTFPGYAPPPERA